MVSKKIDLKDRTLVSKLGFLSLLIWGFDNIDTEVVNVTLIVNGLEYDNEISPFLVSYIETVEIIH